MSPLPSIAQAPFGPVAVLALAALAFDGDAFAQTRICEQDVAQWTAGIDGIGAALEADDVREARIRLELVDDDWACLAEPAPPEPLGEYAQYRAVMAWVALQPDEALRWARSAAYVAPDLSWPAWIDASHPIRSLVEREGTAEVVTVPDRYLAHPKGGGVFLAGGFAAQPVGPEHTPILVQVFDGEGAKVETFWSDGPSVPDRWLTDDPRQAEASAPRWWTSDETHTPAVGRVSFALSGPAGGPSSYGAALDTDLRPQGRPATRRAFAIGAGGVVLAASGLWIASGVLAHGAREAAGDPNTPFEKVEQKAKGANATAALGLVGFTAAGGLVVVAFAW